MEENKKQEVFRCSGDCLSCRKSPNERREQWQYCATQFTYNTMCMVEKMQKELKVMQGTVNDLKTKIEAIQNSEAFDPTGTSEIPTDHDKTQEGDGVGIDAPI